MMVLLLYLQALKPKAILRVLEAMVPPHLVQQVQVKIQVYLI